MAKKKGHWAPAAELAQSCPRIVRNRNLPGFRWFFKNLALHLLEDAVDVLEVRHSQLLDRAYNRGK
jgi:hypothetical protein